MSLIPKEKAACDLGQFEAAYSANESEQGNPTPESLRMAMLRAQLAQFGLSVVQLSGVELAVTGPGAPAGVLPDMRSAIIFARCLAGGAK